MHGFFAELKKQRWDDHRYYHHSRINQSLHLVSALSFLTAYVAIFTNPAAAALIGWLVAMVSRQAGHFFFEPKGYDEVNQATLEHKEDIKVGYNLRRKVVLLSIWALSPLVLWLDPTLFGIFHGATRNTDLLRHISLVWLALGAAALVFRTVQLFVQQSVRPGWCGSPRSSPTRSTTSSSTTAPRCTCCVASCAIRWRTWPTRPEAARAACGA